MWPARMTGTGRARPAINLSHWPSYPEGSPAARAPPVGVPDDGPATRKQSGQQSGRNTKGYNITTVWLHASVPTTRSTGRGQQRVHAHRQASFTKRKLLIPSHPPYIKISNLSLSHYNLLQNRRVYGPHGRSEALRFRHCLNTPHPLLHLLRRRTISSTRTHARSNPSYDYMQHSHTRTRPFRSSRPPLPDGRISARGLSRCQNRLLLRQDSPGWSRTKTT